MLDTVCKDLGKTCPEIIDLKPEFLLWHYLNAMRRKKIEYEEKEEEFRNQIWLLRPDVHEKMVKKETGQVFETPTGGDYSIDDFRKMADKAAQRLKEVNLIDRTPVTDTIEPDEMTNPISFVEE